MLAILMAEKMSGTSVKIIKNEVGCRDDTVPKTLPTSLFLKTRRPCEVALSRIANQMVSVCMAG